MTETKEEPYDFHPNLFPFYPLACDTLYSLFNSAPERWQALWRDNFPCTRGSRCGFGSKCCFPRRYVPDCSFNATCERQAELEADFRQAQALIVADRHCAQGEDEETLAAEDYNEIWAQCAPCEDGPFRLFRSLPPYDLAPLEYARSQDITLNTRLCAHYNKPRVFHQRDCSTKDAAHSFAQFVAPFEARPMLDYFAYWRAKVAASQPHGRYHLPALPLTTLRFPDLQLLCTRCLRRDTLSVGLSLPHPSTGQFPLCVTTCTRCHLLHLQNIYK